MISEKIENDEIENQNIKLLNEFTTFIIQYDNDNKLHLFDIYKDYITGIDEENFLFLDPNKIGIFNPIDMAFKIFENSDLFCINSKMNTVYNRKCNYLLGATVEHYSSPLLSIPITSIIKGNYNNPMNMNLMNIFLFLKDNVMILDVKKV